MGQDRLDYPRAVRLRRRLGTGRQSARAVLARGLYVGMDDAILEERIRSGIAPAYDLEKSKA